jgi:hypothetical protein
MQPYRRRRRGPASLHGTPQEEFPDQGTHPCPEYQGERVLVETLNTLKPSFGIRLPRLGNPTREVRALLCERCGHLYSVLYAKGLDIASS